jgi:exonuclease SbcC
LRITRVELKNIKNHAEGEWAFQPGVVAICGPNGAGKTTILEAIAWALFDHLDYKRDDFVKRGAKRGHVAVAFISDLDGREYVVTRDTGGGYHVYDPETKTRLVEQKNQVTPWLCRHLGVDAGTDLAALFKTTIGVPQGAFTYDFTLPPSNRKGVFDQILKVEEYRQASDNLRDTLRHLDNLISEANRKLAEAEGELKSHDETKRLCDEAGARLRKRAGGDDSRA